MSKPIEINVTQFDEIFESKQKSTSIDLTRFLRHLKSKQNEINVTQFDEIYEMD